MGIRNCNSRWGSIAQSLHWLTAVFVIVTIPFGYVANSLDRGPLERALFDVHFHLGVAVLLLVLVRLIWRSIDPPPPLASTLPARVRFAAKATHVLLYLLLLTMIVSGYIIQVHMWPALTFFGVEIPRPFDPGEDESLRAAAWYVHTWSWWLLAGVVALHAGAALWHHFVCRDDILTRMLPQRRRSAHQGAGRSA